MPRSPAQPPVLSFAERDRRWALRRGLLRERGLQVQMTVALDASAVRERKAVLASGMLFAFEPNACLGRHRVNIGGTVVVAETGCEELNHLPTSVTHKQ